MGDGVIYVYGIAAGLVDVARAPRGVDDAAVRAERECGLTVLCSLLDSSTYAGGEAEARSGDVEWIGPRAVAHDTVLTWASGIADVVPFPMLTLFSGVASLRVMLQERGAELLETIARVSGAEEYTLRVFQVKGMATNEALSRMSSGLAELERRMAVAAPGQRYLLERKLEQARRDELLIIGAAVASEVCETLSAHASGVVRDALPASAADSTGRAVLDASFLVKRDVVAGFSAAVGALAHRYEPSGFRFEFTGPWPVYHFVRPKLDA
ncbi:MAG TPA: GvpL/GvpF family gas vesicle protein [Gemmatimonadaceae bacterium]|jgi:Gas vesicle synthesis protein GvpL/GvpF.